MPAAIEIHNISKTFTERNWKTFLFKKPRYTKALKDISLTVQKGEIMGLIGPNGAGKTTLIKILATLVSPDTGHVTIAGLSLESQSAAIKNKIGLVSTNDRTFYWRLTGRENLDFYATLYNIHGSVKAGRIKEVLQLVEMEKKADFKFMAYSAGQKQRLSIARSMLARPEILLMDEATASLDPLATRRLLDFTRDTLSQKENRTIIWCTHNLNEADEICDQLTILNNGKVIQHGATQSIKNHYAQQQIYSITVDIIHQELRDHAGFHQIKNDNSSQITCQINIHKRDIPSLIRTLTKDGVNIFECTHIERPLETAFHEIVTGNNK